MDRKSACGDGWLELHSSSTGARRVIVVIARTGGQTDRPAGRPAARWNRLGRCFTTRRTCPPSHHRPGVRPRGPSAAAAAALINRDDLENRYEKKVPT